MTESLEKWTIPEDMKVPDFIICGAMKSGTSTLHHILNQHPQIYIPDGELHFFDMDNIFQHSDFNYFDGKTWFTADFENEPARYWKWYTSHFAGAGEDQLIGEDSTTYIASEVAARRIGRQKKEIKLLIFLRQPTERAYSQYWHMVRTGRATLSFEDTLQMNPFSILNRSMYCDQLKRFFEHVPRERIMVVLFEEFLAGKRGILREICKHIGVDFELLPQDAVDAHKNQSTIPRYPALQRMKNRLFPMAGNQHYHAFFSEKREPVAQRKISRRTLVNGVHRILNPLIASKPPDMEPATRQFLNDFFKRELTDIDEILGRDVLSVWFDTELI